MDEKAIVDMLIEQPRYPLALRVAVHLWLNGVTTETLWHLGRSNQRRARTATSSQFFNAVYNFLSDVQRGSLSMDPDTGESRNIGDVPPLA
jgi:hypothetical protein